MVIFLLSCRKEEKDTISYENVSAIIQPGAKTVTVSKTGKNTLIPASLLPSVELSNSSITEPTKLETKFITTSNDDLPEGQVNISTENYLWNFSFNPTLSDSVTIMIPYDSRLDNMMLTNYKYLFLLYSSDVNHENWKIETAAKNDTANNRFSLKVKGEERYYGVFFPEIKEFTTAIMDISLVDKDSSWHHYFGGEYYFSTLPEKFIDYAPQGTFVDKGKLNFKVWTISYDYCRILLQFEPHGTGIYTANQFDLTYASSLMTTGAWGTNFTKTDAMTMEVLKWGNIGEIIEIRIKGIMNSQALGDANTEIYIKTIRCR